MNEPNVTCLGFTPWRFAIALLRVFIALIWGAARRLASSYPIAPVFNHNLILCSSLMCSIIGVVYTCRYCRARDILED